jgi:hypothetical protein
MSYTPQSRHNKIAPPAPTYKVRTINADIFAHYKKVCENSEELMAPEYRQHSHETPVPGEGSEVPGVGTKQTVHAVHIKGGDTHTIQKSAKIECEEFCPECCINDLLQLEGENRLTPAHMEQDYKVAHEDDTIFIEKNDGSEFFVFIVHNT